MHCKVLLSLSERGGGGVRVKKKEKVYKKRKVVAETRGYFFFEENGYLGLTKWVLFAGLLRKEK